MQTHGGAEAEEAILSAERRFHVLLEVDWNKKGWYDHKYSNLSPYVSSVSVDRSLAGAMPEEITLIEGAASAELNVQMSGDLDGISLASALSPYNGRSPFYALEPMGAEVKYSIGVETVVGVVWYPQFVGFVRTVSPDRASDTVVLTALDRVEVLRQPVSLPPWALVQRLSERGNVEAQLSNPQGIIDFCLRHCNTSPTGLRHTYRTEFDPYTPARDDVHFWLSGTGTMTPVKGWHDNANTFSTPHIEAGDVSMYTPGVPAAEFRGAGEPLPLALNAVPDDTTLSAYGDGAELKYWAQDRDQLQTFGTHYFGFTLIIDDAADDTYVRGLNGTSLMTVNIGRHTVVEIFFDGGFVFSRMYHRAGTETPQTSGGIEIPSTLGAIPIIVVWDNTTVAGVRCQIKVGDTKGPFENIMDGPWLDASDDPRKGLIRVRHHVKMQDVAYSARWLWLDEVASSMTDDIWRQSKYLAVLDKGMNRYSYTPHAVAGSDAWDVITQVAAAEWASVHWDEDGIFRFWNYPHMLAKQENIVKTLSLDEVSGLKVQNSLDSVRNNFSVRANKKVSVDTVIFSASDRDQFYVPANSTKLFRVWVDSIMSINPFKVTRYGTDESDPAVERIWDPDADTDGYVVQFKWYDDGSGELRWREYAAAYSGVDIYGYFDYQGRLVINIQNGYDWPCRLVTNGPGDPLDPADSDSVSDGGSPALRMYGSEIRSFDPQVFNHRYENSIAEYGERNLELSGDWYQDKFGIANLIDTMAGRTTDPVPTTDAISVAGDPRLQLGDTIKVRDRDGFGDSMLMQVYGTTRTLSRDRGLEDQLSVEMIRPPRQWILSDPGYSILGRSTSLTSGVYILNENPYFDTNIDGWSAVAGSVSYDPSGTMKVTPDGTSANAMFKVANNVTVEPGQTYEWSFWYQFPNPYPEITSQLIWLDEYGAVIGFKIGSATPSAGVSLNLSVTDTAPAFATQALLRGYIDGTPASTDVFYVNDAIMKKV